MFLTQEQIERIRAAMDKNSESWLKLTARVNQVCEELAAAWQVLAEKHVANVEKYLLEKADEYQAAYDKINAGHVEFERVLAEQEAKVREVEPEKKG